jgi:glutaminyl-tRNA synthetase
MDWGELNHHFSVEYYVYIMSDNKNTSQVPSNFIRGVIERDLTNKTYDGKTWVGSPGDAAHHANAAIDTAKIRTRFPPEPNGYLHIGHIKSIFLNFGLAEDYDGICHLRFDDTNPEKENQEYVDSIKNSVSWLGFSWEKNQTSHLYFASNYFDFMYQAAESLIQTGHAYVDKQSSDEIRVNRGTLTEPGKNSPWRDKSIKEHLIWFREMRDGKHPDGSMILRAKIDMASPNINLRDPVIYRIKRAYHHHTGDTWCIYPMYTFAHPIEDALEKITHSICTLEFEDQRPFYDWILSRLIENGLLTSPQPRQYEFARLNLTYTVLSKRKLIELVEGGYVNGWDDPRLPTIEGAKSRGYSPKGFKIFTDRIGVSKNDSWINYSTLEDCMRDALNDSSERRIAVLDPLEIIIKNYNENEEEECFAPNHPLKKELGNRIVKFSKSLWIERKDFRESFSDDFFGLYPGNMVRLRYAYIVKCIDFIKDLNGNIEKVICEYFPETKSGSLGSNNIKVKGNIHWLSKKHTIDAQFYLYENLFTAEFPGLNNSNFIEELNPDSIKIISGKVEENLKLCSLGEKFQFERNGYFSVKELNNNNVTFNRTVSLKN